MRALIAFGLYMEAECKLVDELGSAPDPAYLAKMHAAFEHTMNDCQSRAHKMVDRFSDALVEQAQGEYLTRAVQDTMKAVRVAPRNMAAGVIESIVGAAVVAAFVWLFIVVRLG